MAEQLVRSLMPGGGGGGNGNGGGGAGGGAASQGLGQLMLATMGAQRGGREGGSGDKSLVGVDGPWNGRPQVGSLYDHLRQGEPRKVAYAFSREEHPVRMLRQQIRPAAGSFVSLAFAQMRDANAVRSRLEGKSDLAEFLGEYNESTAEKHFSTGDIAYQEEKVKIAQEFYRVTLFVPLDYLKENAHTLFDFREDHEDARQFARVVSFVAKAFSDTSVGVSLNRSATQASVAAGFFKTSENQILPRVRSVLEVIFTDNSVTELFQLDPRDAAGEAAFRPMSAEDKSRAFSADKILGFRITYIVLDPALHPAAVFKTRVWKNDYERCRSRDPSSDLNQRLRFSVHTRRRAAWLRNKQAMASDPNLTQAVLEGAPAAQDPAAPPAPTGEDQGAARAIDGDDDDDDDELKEAEVAIEEDPEKLPDAAKKKKRNGKKRAAPDASQSEGTAGVTEDSDDEDESSASGLKGPTPKQRALVAAESVAAAQVRGEFRPAAEPHRDDNGDPEDDWGDQAEEASVDSEGNEVIEGLDDLDDDDDDDGSQAKEAGKRPKRNVKKKAKKDDGGGDDEAAAAKKKKAAEKPKAQPKTRVPRVNKTIEVDVIKSRVAETTVEPTPKTFYRDVFTLERLSQLVYHVYNRAAGSELSTMFPSGIYAPGEDVKELKNDDYDMHADTSPMFFAHTFSFANSVLLMRQALQRRQLSSKRREELVPLPNHLQVTLANYYYGPNEYLSFPFPYAAFEYRPQDLDPEINCDFMLPWTMSRLDVVLESFERSIARRNALVASSLADGASINGLVNSPTALFSNSDSFDQSLGSVMGTIKEKQAPPSEFVRAIHSKIRTEGGDSVQDALFTDSSEAQIASSIAMSEALHDLSGAPAQRAITPWGNTPVAANQAGQGSRSGGGGALRRSAAEMADRERCIEASRKAAQDFAASIASSSIRKTRDYFRARSDPSSGELVRESDVARASARLTGERNAQLLSELLSRVSETDPSGIERVSYAKLANAYQSTDHAVRQALDIMRRQMNVPLSGHFALTSAADPCDGEARTNASEVARQEGGRESDAVKSKLQTRVVEGPTAKARRRLAAKRLRIMKIVSLLPCKNDREAQDWLSAQRPWVVEQARKRHQASAAKVSVVGQAEPAPFDPDAFQLEWTQELEEAYRREALTKLMAHFYEEAASECFGQLTLSNKELPALHQGMLLAMQERKSDVYFSPSWTMDLSMSRWSNSVARDVLDLDSDCGLHTSHVLLLNLYSTFRVTVMNHAVSMPTNFLVLGPPGSEKSHVYGLFANGSIREGIVTDDYSSKLSAFTRYAQDYYVHYQDEARDWIIGDVGKMNREQRQTRDTEKSMLSKGSAAYSRNVESANGKERITETVEVSRRKAIYANTNRIEDTDELSVLNRFRILVNVAWRRIGSTLGDKVTQDRARTDHSAVERFCATKRDMHILSSLVVHMQNHFALPSVSTELMRILMNEGSKELAEYTSYTPGARPSQRGFNDVEGLAVGKAIDRHFCSEDSNMIKWNTTDRSTIERILPLQLRNFASIMPASLCAEYDQVIYAMTEYFKESYPLQCFYVVFALAHRSGGFTRDFYADLYTRYASVVRLPDVERRARERGFASADEDSTLIREFHEYERELRHDAARSYPNHPRMRASAYRTREDRYQAEDEVDRGKNRREKPMRVPKDELWHDPNFISIPCSQGEIIQLMKDAIANDFEPLDQATLRSMMQDMFKREVRIPAMKRVQKPRADSLEMEGCASRFDEKTGEWSVSGTVQWRTVPMLHYSRRSDGVGEGGYLTIPVHFLMQPYPYILQLFLTRHENRHTRRLKCVIPIQMRGMPQLLHRHYVRPREEHLLRSDNPHFVPHSIERINAMTDTGAMAQDLASHAVRAPASGAQRNDQVITFHRDPEMYCFVRHLLENSYTPHSTEAESVASWTRETMTPAERFAELANKHPQRPGATEERIWYRRKNWPYFKNSKETSTTVVYPDTLVEEFEAINYVKRANDERERRADKERLTEAELEELCSVYLSKAFVERPKQLRRLLLQSDSVEIDNRRQLVQQHRERANDPRIRPELRKEYAVLADKFEKECEARAQALQARSTEADDRRAYELYTAWSRLDPASEEAKLLWAKPCVRDVAELAAWKRYAALSSRRPAELSEAEVSDLARYVERYGRHDFVVMYMAEQQRARDEERREAINRYLDEYTHDKIRSRPVSKASGARVPPGSIYTPVPKRHEVNLPEDQPPPSSIPGNRVDPTAPAPPPAVAASVPPAAAAAAPAGPHNPFLDIVKQGIKDNVPAEKVIEMVLTSGKRAAPTEPTESAPAAAKSARRRPAATGEEEGGGPRGQFQPAAAPHAPADRDTRSVGIDRAASSRSEEDPSFTAGAEKSDDVEMWEEEDNDEYWRQAQSGVGPMPGVISLK